tara:strand:- start:79 stop:348 length:270 start_codon:yes stop_codon:yes gene_type:complete
MKRYLHTGLKKRKNISSRLTTIYLSVPERNDDLYFIAQEGDRCDNLAYKFYGDVTLWWFIARVNHLTSNNIPAGTSLRIPISTTNARGF